jgi:hypothetical protein
MQEAQLNERSSAEPFQMWQPPFGLFPFLPIATDGNQAQAAHRLFVGWTAFVHHRIEEDIRLMHDVAKSKSTADFWKAYFGFWQTAVEDYWKEYAAVTQASGGLIRTGDGRAHEPANAIAKPSPRQAA